VAMPGLLGLRIFETTGADVTDLGDEARSPVLRVRQKRQGLLIALPLAVLRGPEGPRHCR
jgi:integrase/recombinase XerD